MAITAAMCNQFKVDALNGVHQPADVYKLALYTSAATLDKTTTAYTASGEVAAGGGYSAGGITLSNFNVALVGDTATLDFDDAVIATATIANVVGAVLYNSTRSNKAMAVFSFASTTSTNAEFRVAIPSGLLSIT